MRPNTKPQVASAPSNAPATSNSRKFYSGLYTRKFCAGKENWLLRECVCNGGPAYYIGCCELPLTLMLGCRCLGSLTMPSGWSPARGHSSTSGRIRWHGWTTENTVPLLEGPHSLYVSTLYLALRFHRSCSPSLYSSYKHRLHRGSS